MNVKLKELEKVLGKGRVRQNEPMKLHTTFKIGGPAQFYLNVDKIDDLVKTISLSQRLNLPFFVFGGGSNILVSDKGIKGLVIKNNCRLFEVVSMSGRMKNRKIDLDKALIFAESGVVMNQLVRFTIDQGLGGLEYQLGLPGTVGGAVFMNSNFPKKEAFVGDCVFGAKLLLGDGVVKEVDRSYFHFDYDQSILQKKEGIVLSVIFKLLPEEKKILWERGMEALNYRNSNQPKGASAGCIFRNISTSLAMNIPTPNHITSAGYLIDKAGLKGKRIGDAMISDMHANYIINLGSAKADDVLGLINLAREEVFRKFGVNLDLEVKRVGFD